MPDIQTVPTDQAGLPWGSLAGYYDAMNNMAIQKSQEQTLQGQNLDNIVKQRNAALAQDQINSQDYRNWSLQGDIGKNQSSAAQGSFDQTTLPAKTKFTNTDYYNKQNRADLERQAGSLDNLRFSLVNNGPAGVAKALENLDEEDKTTFTKMIQTKGPQAVSEYLRSLSDDIRNHLSTNDVRGNLITQGVKNKGDLDQENLKGKYHLAGIETQGRTNKELEQMRIDAGKYNKVLRDSFASFYKLRSDAQLAQIIAGLKVGKDPITQAPIDEEGQTYWMEQARVLSATMNARNQAATNNKADIGQLGLTPTQPTVVPSAPSGQTPQLPKGWTIK
jgi:hypothetical protein